MTGIVFFPQVKGHKVWYNLIPEPKSRKYEAEH